MEKRIQTVNKSPIRYKQITHLIFLICFAFYNIGTVVKRIKLYNELIANAI